MSDIIFSEFYISLDKFILVCNDKLYIYMLFLLVNILIFFDVSLTASKNISDS